MRFEGHPDRARRADRGRDRPAHLTATDAQRREPYERKHQRQRQVLPLAEHAPGKRQQHERGRRRHPPPTSQRGTGGAGSERDPEHRDAKDQRPRKAEPAADQGHRQVEPDDEWGIDLEHVDVQSLAAEEAFGAVEQPRGVGIEGAARLADGGEHREDHACRDGDPHGASRPAGRVQGSYRCVRRRAPRGAGLPGARSTA